MDVATYILCKSFAKKYTDQVTQSLIGGVHYRGSVNYYADLPNDAQEGDSYTVKYAGTSGSIADGTEYTWGYDTDLEDYAWISFSKDAYSKAETDDTFVKKVDEYNAGKTVPKGTVVTINGQSYTVGDNAEIFNKYSKNKAVGNYSHAEGDGTTASGANSHAEGGGTTASGMNSHAEGGVTIASSDYQHVEGKYNVEDANDKFAHIIGNGTSNKARSNAYAIDWDGKIYTHNSTTGFDINNNYLEMPNGIRLYISATAPTGNIPDGSVGVGW